MDLAPVFYLALFTMANMIYIILVIVKIIYIESDDLLDIHGDQNGPY